MPFCGSIIMPHKFVLWGDIIYFLKEGALYAVAYNKGNVYGMIQFDINHAQRVHSDDSDYLDEVERVLRAGL